MAATVGWIVNEAGIVFDGNIATGVPFSSLGKGVQAWENVPDAGKLQIILAAGAIEFASEAKQPHYMRAARAGQTAAALRPALVGPPNYNGGMDEETKATKRQMEVNNGRLAMIGAASFVAASYIPEITMPGCRRRDASARASEGGVEYILSCSGASSRGSS